MRVACLAALAAIPCLLFSKTPITHEDVWLMKRVDAPFPSPDGKWVVFSVTEPAYDEKDQSSDLWIVASDGSARPRRITQTKAPESGATWSSDSTHIAFSSKRDGDDVPQIYIIDLKSGGEAARVTSLSTPASSPKFSPDGRSLLFQSVVYPGAADDAANRKMAADRKGRKHNARVYDTFPIRYWDKWLDDTQRHLFVQALEPGAKARDLLAGTKLALAAGFAGASTISGQELYAVWAPGGRSIVFTATSLKNQAAYADAGTDLYKVAATGGEPQKMTSDRGSYSKPVFDPTGTALYATFEPQNQSVYNLDRVVRFEWPNGGQPTVVTADFDRSVSGYTFSPDGRTMYFTAEDAGREKLYSVSAIGGVVKPVGDLKLGCYSNLAGSTKSAALVLVAAFDSAVNPPEIVRVDATTGERTFLTNFNRDRAGGLDIRPLLEFWSTSSTGKTIQSFIALPPEFSEGKKYPLFVVMHGGPHSMWRDQWVLRWNYHLLARPGYVVLLTNYTGSTGFGEKFAQQIQGDPLLGPAKEINEAADAAIANYAFIDGSRQAAGGASYGGHLANWLQASTTRYKCLISHAGLINLESQWGTSDTIYHRERGMGGPVWDGAAVWREQNPIRYANQFKTPVLLTVGENDFRVPLNQTIENWSVLQRLKVPSRLIVFPEANHWIMKGEDSRFWYGAVHKWLAQWLNR